MQSYTVVVAHSDSCAAQKLETSLRAHFRRVVLTRDHEQLKNSIVQSRANLAVVDLDMLSIDEVKELCADFGYTKVICVHRAPDYEMWNEAMGAGALECCHPSDIPAILNAMRAVPVAKAKAAAA